MDAIDLKIIDLLQKTSRLSITELSRIISLSRPSTNERVTKLLEKGVIEQFTALISAKKIGYHVSFYIQVSELKIPYTQFVEVLLKEPAVTEIHAVTGSANYILKAFTKDIHQMHELLAKLMPYGKMNTSVILNTPLENKPLAPIKQ